MNGAYVQLHTEITEPRMNHVWTDGYGEIHATVQLADPGTYIRFDSAEAARQFAAVCVEAAGAIEAEAVRAAGAEAAAEAAWASDGVA